MSSDLQSTVAELQFTNYIDLVISSAVVYDYIITFGQEIDYIWTKSWSLVTVIFFLGLLPPCSTSYSGVLSYLDLFWCTVLDLLAVWSFQIFLAAADIMMILRVYAMYAKSRVVLGALLVVYVSETVLFFYSAALYNNPSTNLTMTVAQVLDLSFCNPMYNTVSRIGAYKFIPRFLLAGLLFILAVARLCMEAFQAYRVARRWHVNQYIRRLVQDGVFYFFVHLMYIIDFGETTAATIVTTLATVFMFVLSPRFIMSMRAMHRHSLAHVSGQATAIDVGFGVKSWSSQMSSVGFATSNTESETMENSVEMREVGTHLEP